MVSTVCRLLSSGCQTIIGPTDPILSSYVQSVCDALDIPHFEFRGVNPSTSNSWPMSSPLLAASPASSPDSDVVSSSSKLLSHVDGQGYREPNGRYLNHPTRHHGGRVKFSVNMHPSETALHKAFRDTVIYLNWTSCAIIYESPMGEKFQVGQFSLST